MNRTEFFRKSLYTLRDYRTALRSHAFAGELTTMQIKKLDQEFERIYTEFGDFELSVREELVSMQNMASTEKKDLENFLNDEEEEVLAVIKIGAKVNVWQAIV